MGCKVEEVYVSVSLIVTGGRKEALPATSPLLFYSPSWENGWAFEQNNKVINGKTIDIVFKVRSHEIKLLGKS